MIRIYVAAVLILTIATASAAQIEGFNESSRDRWTGKDKAEHFAAGFLIASGAYLMADEIAPDAKPRTKFLVAIAASVIAGAAKEAYDYRHPANHDASAKDFTATVAGGLAGGLAVGWVIDF